MARYWKEFPAIWLFTALFVVLSIVSSIIGLSPLATKLNENQVLYLFSTTGQVIAAVYGLTLTGFIFFRNELSREEFEDETLAEAVDALKARYFVLLAFITLLVLLTIFLSNLAIAKEAVGPTFGNAAIINTGQSAFVTSLLAVAYFVFDVVSPRRIENASRRLQDEVDPSRSEQTKGSLEEFLTNYNQIEALLNVAGFPYQQSATASIDRGRPRHISNIRLAEILFRNERIDKLQFAHLRELITLRNSIIHGAEPIVSQQAVSMSRDVLERLRSALSGGEGEL
ncbi:hypothetical protein [Variovorax guangxiensis]|uniref:hypothetical protein n=1 Tax=Variovorax guangxiensis TaxID=1775474 RepID=UPI002861E8F2|nr:hypothetical protein [Variovorax guangxiensis]MDR6857872.1 uncharacterized protein YutE (UPF0331/DUF86 family) [Variovorax guangxiensis]